MKKTKTKNINDDLKYRHGNATSEPILINNLWWLIIKNKF